MAQWQRTRLQNAGEVGPMSGLGRSFEEGDGNPLQNSCLGNPMDRGAWKTTDHGVAKSQTQLSTHASTDSPQTLIGLRKGPVSVGSSSETKGVWQTWLQKEQEPGHM